MQVVHPESQSPLPDLARRRGRKLLASPTKNATTKSKKELFPCSFFKKKPYATSSSYMFPSLSLIYLFFG